MAKGPIAKYRAGAVSATVWENTQQFNGKDVTTYSVTLERNYKDKDGKWQKTNNLGTNDLQKAILVLQEAQKRLLMAERLETADLPSARKEVKPDDNFEGLKEEIVKEGYEVDEYRDENGLLTRSYIHKGKRGETKN